MARMVEQVEKTITQLPSDQPREFRAWYERFDSETWDEKIEKDILSGKLDTLAKTAIAAHKEYDKVIAPR